MKNIINRALAAEKKLFTLLLAVAASVGTMFAESGTCGDNLTWNLTGGVLTISGTGAMNDYSGTSAPWFSYYSSIKSVIVENGVTSIGKYAFYKYYSSLTSVTIPGSVTSIGNQAFHNCTCLTSVHISDLSAWCAIGFGGLSSNPLYYAHYLYLNETLLTDLIIPNSITSIGNYAFAACSVLTSITCEAVTPPTLGSNVFYDVNKSIPLYVPAQSVDLYKAADQWKDFTNILPIEETPGTCITASGTCGAQGDNLTWELSCDSILTISGTGEMANYSNVSSVPWYSYHSSIQYVVIGNNVTSIGELAFNNCTSLTSVTIGNSVTSIGRNAFFYCSGLTSVTIPNSVTSIGSWAFRGCSGLTSIIVENGNTKYDSRDNCNAIIETSTNMLIAGCQNTTIPNSVTSIGENAFYGCSGLTSVTIPNSVTSIGSWAFYDCSGLTSVTIPNSVTSIGSYAFEGCTGLTKVNITDIAAWCNITFSSYNSNPLYYVKHLYVNNVEVTELVIPNSVTSIRNYAFCYCTSLTSVTIPNSVTSIGESAFSGCTGLTSLTIPNSVTSIGNSAFKNVLNIVYNGTATGSPWGAKSMNGYVDGYLVYSDATKTVLLGCSLNAIGEIVIPNSVTSIGDRAFYNCTSLTSVTIPNSVTSIGYRAFYRCQSLTSVTIPNSVTSIGEYTFQNCTGLTSVTIGNSVTSIGEYAFQSCSGLTSVTIPNSVTSIGIYAFNGCRGLTSVTIPNSVTSIGEYAFQSCTGLTSVTITDIAAWCNIAFSSYNSNPLYYAKHLYVNNVEVTNLVIPEGVTSIGNYAFYNCTSLTSVTIPNSVTSIGYRAFYRCQSLTSVTIPNSVTSIGEEAFEWCTGLTSVTIGNSVTSIGNSAFYNCTSLTSVTIPNSVTSIGDGAFYGCSGLTSVTIGNSVTSIGKEAFRECASLTSVTIPNSVTSIGESAFQNCGAITEVTIGSGLIALGKSVFNKCTAIELVHWNAINYRQQKPNQDSNCFPFYSSKDNISTFVFGDSVTYIPAYLLKDFRRLESIVIPAGVTEIGEYAFAACSVLTSITCEAVTPPTLGSDVFYNVNKSIPLYVPAQSVDLYKAANQWKDFTNILPIEETPGTCITASGTCGAQGDNLTWELSCDSILTISGTGEMANYSNVSSVPWYSYNSSIQYVVIGNNVTSIGSEAFRYCTGLTSVTIPNSVTSIGEYAFAYCSGLTSVTIPNSVTSIGYGAFQNCTGLTSVTIGNSVTSIGVAAFYMCTGLTSVTIPNSVTSIGRWTFEDCRGLTSVTIPNSVTSIGVAAFSGCTGLTSVTIPNSVTSIGSSAFASCTGLTSIDVASDNSNYCSVDGVLFNKDKTTLIQYPGGKQGSYTIPNSVTSIGDYAFRECTGLTSVTIPNSVTSIGDGAFYGCTGLTSVTIPNSVIFIGRYAFYGCHGLTSVTIGNSVTSIGEEAFEWCTGLTSITCEAVTPPSLNSSVFGGVDKSIPLYVPAESVSAYQSADQWKDFTNILPIEAQPADVTTTTVTPSETTADIAWPQVTGAATYTIEIKKNGELICTLTFNAQGQLISIAFNAPSRNNAPQQAQAAGFSFTVTSLDSGTTYSYTMTAKGNNGNVLKTESGTFTTTGTATGIEDVQGNNVQCTKVLHNGQVLILRGEKVYSIDGRKVK